MNSSTLLTFLALSLTVSAASLVQRNWDAVCFDLNANGGRGPGHESSKCRIYAYNNGHTNYEDGIEDYWFADCINLSDPSRWSYTIIWTSCDDALWIDQMHLMTTWCSVLSNDARGCATYGADNQAGWCLSTDKRDGEGSWKKYTPSGCFKTLRLGKPGYKDTRVWGYDHSNINSIKGRRELSGPDGTLSELKQKVKDCEATGKNCKREVSKVFKLFESLDEDAWVTAEGKVTGEKNADENKLDEHCSPVVKDYENEVHQLKDKVLDLQRSLEKEEEIRSLQEKVTGLAEQLQKQGRRSRL